MKLGNGNFHICFKINKIGNFIQLFFINFFHFIIHFCSSSSDFVVSKKAKTSPEFTSPEQLSSSDTCNTQTSEITNSDFQRLK